MWFVGVLFYALLTFSVFRKIIHYFKISEINQILFSVCILIFGVFTNFPYRISNIFIAFFFISMGFILKNQHYIKLRLNQRIHLALFITLTISLIMLTKYSYVSVATNSFENKFLFLINSFSGIFLVYTLSDILMQISIAFECLKWLGKNSFSIMGWHFWGFKVIIFIQILLYDLPRHMINCFPVIYEYISFAWILSYIISGVIVSMLLSDMCQYFSNVTSCVFKYLYRLSCKC